MTLTAATPSDATTTTDKPKAPVTAGWVLLALAWVVFLIPLPIGLIGWALNLAALIVAIIVMAKGRVGPGVGQLVCAIVVSPLVYFAGWMVMAAVFGTSR